MTEGWTCAAGRWQVTTTDSEVLVVDKGARRLELDDGTAWVLDSVDDCTVGTPGAFTVRDDSGIGAPWFTSEVVSVVRLLR